MTPDNYQFKIQFCQWLLHQITDQSSFLCFILWMDEAYLHETAHSIVGIAEENRHEIFPINYQLTCQRMGR